MEVFGSDNRIPHPLDAAIHLAGGMLVGALLGWGMVRGLHWLIGVIW